MLSFAVKYTVKTHIGVNKLFENFIFFLRKVQEEADEVDGKF